MRRLFIRILALFMIGFYYPFTFVSVLPDYILNTEKFKSEPVLAMQMIIFGIIGCVAATYLWRMPIEKKQHD